MELNRVLIVDDDPAVRRVVSALPDLVILDLTMPGWTGSGPAPPCARTRTWPGPGCRS